MLSADIIRFLKKTSKMDRRSFMSKENAGKFYEMLMNDKAMAD